jgi:uncharacterized protein (TIGR03437 family)
MRSNPSKFGDGAAAALNGDGINDPAKVSCTGPTGPAIPVFCPGGVRPVKRGEMVVLYLTGQGVVDGAPADGEAAQGEIRTTGSLRVIIGTQFVADSDILFSGLAPTLVGVWQINVRVPQSAASGQPNPVAVLYRDVPTAPQTAVKTVIEVQ